MHVLKAFQKYIVCRYGYKLVRVEDKCSKPFNSHVGENAVYAFINSMVEESKYCRDVMKKLF